MNIPFFVSKSKIPTKDKIEKPVKTVSSVLKALLSSFSRAIYESPEANLLYVRDCLLEESIFRRAVDKIQEQIWKNGWTIVGKNLKNVNYIKKRLREIEEVSGVSTQELLERISRQLIVYSNCFIIKVRKANSSTGLPRKTLSGKLLQPVAAFFPQSAIHVKIQRGDEGGIKSYLFANTDEYKLEDVIHIYMHKEEGFAFGTPMVIPVLEDITALRQVEEHANILVYQHAIPLYHFIIGTDLEPGQTEEIDLLNAEINSMPAYGSLTTTNRVKIEVLGTKKEGMDLAPMLEYWKTRVLGGLGISGIGMGEAGSANRGTAAYVDKEFQNTTAMFQRAIKHAFDNFIVKELLAEAKIDPLTTEEKDRVLLYIPEIDLDQKNKKEVHATFLYEHNAITEDEMRILLGMDPVKNDADRRRMITWLVKVPLALVGARDETLAQYPDLPYPEGSFGMGNAETNNKEQPTNQYGKKPIKNLPKND